jgi:hypothetical protein
MLLYSSSYRWATLKMPVGRFRGARLETLPVDELVLLTEAPFAALYPRHARYASSRIAMSDLAAQVSPDTPAYVHESMKDVRRADVAPSVEITIEEDDS